MAAEILVIATAADGTDHDTCSYIGSDDTVIDIRVTLYLIHHLT